MSVTLGTPLSAKAKRVLLLGAGELGKEVALELQRFGCEVIACDRYAHAPAMQVAHRRHVFSMLDGEKLREIIREEKPDLVVPELEAIATDALVRLEAEGVRVVPTARATQLTMNREGIRKLASETLGLPTSGYRFVESLGELRDAARELGMPCVLKPLMSSSGKGQSVIRDEDELEKAWAYAIEGGRASGTRCIVEAFVRFDYEITVLTVSAVNGLFCCPPIGHIQVDGDYRESWQPMPMSAVAWERSQALAKRIVTELGGYGVFGVELFVRADEVVFSEVSPRPHDTGLVTLASQPLSEFALHVRAILGLPIPELVVRRPGASVPILGTGEGVPRFEGLDTALAVPESQLRLFGKPICRGARRLGVALATANDLETARARAKQIADAVRIVLD